MAILRELDTHRTDEPEIGPMGARIVGRLFDIFLVGTVWVTVVYVADTAWQVILARDPGYRADPRPPDIPVWAQVLGIVALFAAIVVYEVIATRFFEATVGKRMMGLRIVRMDGRTRARAVAVCWRTALWAGTLIIVAVVPVVTPIAWATFIAIGGLIALASHDRLNRAVHDRLAGTRVVRPR